MTTATENFNDPMMPKAHIPVPQHRTYIPEWGAKHTDPGLPVSFQGNPTGYCVRDILPWKRWAIDPGTGEIMGQAQFEPLYQRWIAMVCRGDGTIVAVAAMDENFDSSRESCPGVNEFVLQTLDEAGRPVPVGWEEKNRQTPTGPRLLWDSEGREGKTAAQTLRIYRARRAMTELQKMEPLKAALPAEKYQERVDAVLAKHEISVDDLAEGLATAPKGFDSVEVTEQDITRLQEQADREAAAADSEPGATPQPGIGGPEGAGDLPPPAPAATFAAPCGKPCKTNAGAGAHARKCGKCKAIAAEAAEAEVPAAPEEAA